MTVVEVEGAATSSRGLFDLYNNKAVVKFSSGSS